MNRRLELAYLMVVAVLLMILFSLVIKPFLFITKMFFTLHMKLHTKMINIGDWIIAVLGNIKERATQL